MSKNPTSQNDNNPSNAEDLQKAQTALKIVDTLATYGVDVQVKNVTKGPTCYTYHLDCIKGSSAKILRLGSNLAEALDCPHNFIVYNNYETGCVCVDVPRRDRQFITRKEMMPGSSSLDKKPTTISFPLGVNNEGENVFFEVKKAPHLLISGGAGTGKSIFLQSLILSLMEANSPQKLRFILIDPKAVELTNFEGAPHLLTGEILTSPDQASRAFLWAIEEMNRRYELFKKMSLAGTYVVNIDNYNSHVEEKAQLPHILIVIDEFADLMCTKKKEIEESVQCLTTKARASGIHLIMSTQRPSVDIITGVIKANIPSRICFSVSSEIDSRVTLDAPGAEKLLGLGDMICVASSGKAPIRLQAPYSSADDLKTTLSQLRDLYPANFDEKATAYMQAPQAPEKQDPDLADISPLHIGVLAYAVLAGSISISKIQIRFAVGFNKAAHIFEWMEENGYIAPFNGSPKPRKVLLTQEEFIKQFGANGCFLDD